MSSPKLIICQFCRGSKQKCKECNGKGWIYTEVKQKKYPGMKEKKNEITFIFM